MKHLTIPADIVDLGAVSLHPAVEKTHGMFVKQFGADEARRAYTENDWKRISFVMEKAIPGVSVLDVGTGQGHLSNAMACSGRYANVATIDIKRSTKYHQYFPHERMEMSVTDMTFLDNAFDVVVCLEVIEHLPDEVSVERALRELNRVASKQLLVSIPLFEPLPLPRYHHHRFDTQKIQTMFSGYDRTVLFKAPVTRVPWLLMEKVM